MIIPPESKKIPVESVKKISDRCKHFDGRFLARFLEIPCRRRETSRFLKRDSSHFSKIILRAGSKNASNWPFPVLKAAPFWLPRVWIAASGTLRRPQRTGCKGGVVWKEARPHWAPRLRRQAGWTRALAGICEILQDSSSGDARFLSRFLKIPVQMASK